MSASSIKITFTEDLPIGAQLGFDVVNDGGLWGTPTVYAHLFNWVNIRSASGQVTQGVPTANIGERAAINFVVAFNLDAAGQYTVERTLNQVTIVSQNLNALVEFYENPYDNHPSIVFEIINGNSEAFGITSIVYNQSAGNSCTHIDAVITTSELATQVLNPIVINPNANNPFTLNLLRGQTLIIRLKNATGNFTTDLLETPVLLSALNFELQITNSPYGASVLVNSTNSDQLSFEYSLDNESWQNSNEFSGLAPGDYTLYVKDQFGCSVSKEFNVNEFGIQSPYFYISKSNSFRFANRVTWGDSENYKKDENTLSCEVDVELAYKETQQFQSADVITTQFKSNYLNKAASIIKSDNSVVEIPIIQKTNNIGLKDKRDARIYNLGGGKTGIYFVSGNIYDYVTNGIINTYALNGLLPEWAVAGNHFSIGTTFYLIEDVVFDEVKNADILVFTSLYNAQETNIIVGSVYNRFNYDVFEFSIDMVNYIDQKIRVQLVNSDPNFTTLTHLSEEIWCKVKHENVIEIRYRNSTNTDVLYSTGIEHKIRIPYLKISGKSDENSEIHKTDTDTILLNSDIYEADDFQFEPVTKEIWRKLIIALSHEKVLLNGVGYVKNGSFNTDGPLERSNLYVLTASMIKTSSVYNSQTSGGLDFDGTEVEVPGLISSENGFIKY